LMTLRVTLHFPCKSYSALHHVWVVLAHGPIKTVTYALCMKK
jgi:hypothetical protein